jgi:hypothetical protein
MASAAEDLPKKQMRSTVSVNPADFKDFQEQLSDCKVLDKVLPISKHAQGIYIQFQRNR